MVANLARSAGAASLNRAVALPICGGAQLNGVGSRVWEKKMTALAWLIPMALGLGVLGLGAFIWAMRSGQFEDLEGAAWRVLEDREPDEK